MKFVATAVSVESLCGEAGLTLEVFDDPPRQLKRPRDIAHAWDFHQRGGRSSFGFADDGTSLVDRTIEWRGEVVPIVARVLPADLEQEIAQADEAIAKAEERLAKAKERRQAVLRNGLARGARVAVDRDREDAASPDDGEARVVAMHAQRVRADLLAR